MALQIDRATLQLRLLSGIAFESKERAETLRLIDKWWMSYKLWEKQDRFLTAFKEGRLTMRQAPSAATTYGSYGDYTSGAAFSANRSTEGKVEYEKERYRVDIGAMKERLDPSNFGMDGGERLKYKKGLHDLSASLCVPTMPLLTKQMRWKPTNLPGKADNWVMIFMPLAKAEDYQLFHLLSSTAKKVDTELALVVANIRRRMTRIKFADSVDIGAGLRDIAKPGDDPKFRYGLTSPLSPEGKLAGDDLARRQKALDYTSILPKAPLNPVKPSGPPPKGTPGTSGPPPPPPGGPGKDTNTNEVVIAYREHEGPRFPVFTQYMSKSTNFVCLKGEASSNAFPKGFIPNNWANTIEV